MSATTGSLPAAARPSATVSRPRQRPSETPRVNVGDVERWLSVLGGSALGVYGLKRGRLAGLGLAALGGALVYRGASGHCSLYGALGVSTA
jgi:uncharacterized membrane protein